jgi:hypothetical protein
MGGGEYLRFVYETGFFTHLGTLYNRAAAIKIRFYTADINSSDMESLVRLALEGKVLIRNTLAGCWIIFWELTTSSLLREAIRMIWTSPALPKLSNRDSACMKLLDIGPPPSVGDELRCAAGKLLRCRPGLCRTFSWGVGISCARKPVTTAATPGVSELDAGPRLRRVHADTEPERVNGRTSAIAFASLARRPIDFPSRRHSGSSDGRRNFAPAC